ncbi:DUF4199 domain-containing protein [Winogradskyella sp.]|uniref:DUF4199 domain-containing protein n=1 Tax=Winogradskyella sp. TaxID=1883156 RepID=UPI00262DEB24|nr:DUF4199 domain-containing protein [Winogradskyella sp.]
MEKSLKSSSANYGLYLGLILSALTIIGYAVSLDLFTKWWFGILLLLIVIILGIMSSMKARKLLGGFISFKNAFTAYFIAILVGILLSSLVSFLIFNVVDPDAASILQEKIIESQVQMLERFGTPQDAIDKAVSDMQANGSMYSIGNILKSIAYQLVGFSIVGLIVALVVKKSDPNAA